MKKVALLAVLFLLHALPAAAQINLAWRNCITRLSAVANIDYACDGSVNGIPFRAYASFIAPANVADFIGVHARVEVSTASPILPDFWRLGVGECRTLNLHFPVSLIGIGSGAAGECQNPYLSSTITAGAQYSSGVPSVDLARIDLVQARSSPRSLVQGEQYVAFGFGIDTFKDIDSGTGVCAGCEIPACLQVVELTIDQSSGASTTLFAPATRSHVTWQGGFSNCAGATPTRKPTWGSIKSLYR